MEACLTRNSCNELGHEPEIDFYCIQGSSATICFGCPGVRARPTPNPKFGLDVETDDATHAQEGMKRSITHRMSLSGESRAGSQSGLKMA